MTRLPPLRAKELIRILLRADFYEHHQTGGHVQLRHKVKTNLRVTVPRHDHFDLPPFVVQSILKQADISRKELFEMLEK